MAEDDENNLRAVLRTLGRLEGKVDSLTDDQREDRELARESRARLHERLDEQNGVLTSQNGVLSAMQFGIKVGADIDAQVRNELDALKKEVEPVTTHVKTLKWIAAGIAGALTLSGATVAFAADLVRDAVKSWLGA